MLMSDERILVTAKVNPDLDGVACTLAYADLLVQSGKMADGIITGSPQSEVQYFMEKQGISITLRDDNSDGEWKNFTLVDASSMKGMPKVVEADKVIEVIDHRTGEPEKEFLNAKIQNELIGAAATIVVERFIQLAKKPNPEQAMLLYGAIYHNTLNFVATNSTARDRQAVKFLESKYNLRTNIIREMFDFSTEKIEKDINLAMDKDVKEFGEGNTITGYQLVVWGNGILKQKEAIEKKVEDIRKEKKAQSNWFFVNIIDVGAKQSHLYSTQAGLEILSKALKVRFEDGWTTLPAILRKQIVAKIFSLLYS